MLRGVVRKGGTGELASIDGYTVAGKTGTSRKPPYETERYMASFAGFAPAENPRLAAIIVIDQPGTNNDQYYGGKVAAPLFKSIMTVRAPPRERAAERDVRARSRRAPGLRSPSASRPPRPRPPRRSPRPPPAPAAVQPASIVANPVP